MNEKISSTPVPAANAGTKTPAGTHPGVAPAAKPVSGLADTASAKAPPLVAPASQQPQPFGGHKGGGKKRLDGLPSGSEAAKAADRKKDADRKAEKRAAEKLAQIPAPLSPPASPAPSANVPLAPTGNTQPDSVAGAQNIGPVAAAPAFVPWLQARIQKPARLLTKIMDRFRVARRMRRIRTLNLPKEANEQIQDVIKVNEEIRSDLESALAMATTEELNRRRVPGSQHSHWIDVGMCMGEYVLADMEQGERIERIILKYKTAANPEEKKP